GWAAVRRASGGCGWPGWPWLPPAATQRSSLLLERLGLERVEPAAAVLGQVQQRTELAAVEACARGSALDLDEGARSGDHDVHVGLGADVLPVLQVQQRAPLDDADADRADRVGQDLAGG